MKSENIEALLAHLCPEDREEAGRRYSVLHAKVAGFFRLKGMTDPEGDADDALDRAGEKIRKGYNIPDINKFCIGIARKIVLERLRQKRREENAFLKLIQDNEDTASLEEQMNRMKWCFMQLPAKERYVLLKYCNVPPGLDRAEYRFDLAKRLNSTIGALRIRVARRRQRLHDCLKRMKEKR